MVIRLSALSALRSLLGLWDLDADQCLAPALGWLVPALYGMFEDVAEMENRQEVRATTPILLGCCCCCCAVFDGTVEAAAAVFFF